MAMSDSQMSMAQNKRRSQASKGKGSLYITLYPVRWTAQSASHFFLPWQTCSFRHRSSILAKLQLRATTKSLTFPPLSIAMYSFTAESTGASMERTKMPNFETVAKQDSNTGSLDCESGILPLSYRGSMSELIIMLATLSSFLCPLTVRSLAVASHPRQS